MIKIQNLTVQYIKEFASNLDYNNDFSKNTLLIADDINSTALFRSIMRIDKFTGSIYIDDIPNTQIKGKNYPICYLPKTSVLFNHKTARKNIEYSLKIRKFNKKEIKDKIDNLISNYNIDFLDKKVKKLTLSEQKLTTLFRAIIHEPKYILLEDFLTDFDNKYLPIFSEIITNSSTIFIASEESDNYNKFYTNFSIEKL